MKKSVTPLTIYESLKKDKLNPLDHQQMLHIMQKTPSQHIYTRPGKGGGVWTYVTGVYVEKVLNYVFGWNWDFEIKDRVERDNQIAVLGRLTVRTATGDSIFKEQWGRSDIKMKRDTNTALDYGNDLKSASTDALKKCASLLGIASDIYGKNEFREIKTEPLEDLPEVKKLENTVKSSIDITKIT